MMHRLTLYSRLDFRAALVVLVGAFAGLASGCGILEEMVSGSRLPVITESGKTVTPAGGPDQPNSVALYPVKAPIGEPLDVHILRNKSVIRIDNRTTRTIKGAQLWLNHEFGANVGDIPIGLGPQISLKSFINHHDEHYPVGTFLAPEIDRKLVLADLLIEGKIHKCVVRLAEDWQLP